LECFGKSPSVDYPIDLTSLYALHTDPQEEFWQRIHFAQLAFALPSTRHGYLTDGLGPSVVVRLPMNAITMDWGINAEERAWKAVM